MYKTLITFWQILTDSKAVRVQINLPILTNLLYALKMLIGFGLIVGTYHALTTVPYFIRQSQELFIYVEQNLPQDMMLNWSGQELTIKPIKFSIQNHSPIFLDNSSKYLLVFIDGKFDDANIASQMPGSSIVTITSDKIFYTQQAHLLSNTLTQLLPSTPGQLSAPDANLVFTSTLDTLLAAKIFIQIATPLFVIIGFMINDLWLVFINSCLVILFIRLYKIQFSTQVLVNLVILLTIPALLLSQISQILYPASNWPLFDLWFWPSLLVLIYKLKFADKKIT